MEYAVECGSYGDSDHPAAAVSTWQTNGAKAVGTSDGDVGIPTVLTVYKSGCIEGCYTSACCIAGCDRKDGGSWTSGGQRFAPDEEDTAPDKLKLTCPCMR